MELTELQIELSGVCNVRCPYCTWTERTTGKRFMDRQLISRLINDAAALAPHALVTFHGVGESTMHPSFLGIMDEAGRSELKLRLSTNCLLLKGAIAGKLRKIKRLDLILSLHTGLPASIHTECVANALDYLSMRTENHFLEVLTVCDTDTAPLAPWFVETFLPIIEKLPNARLHFKQPWTFPTSAPIRGRIPNIADHPQIDVERAETPRSIGRGCRMPEYFLVVQADGTPAPCCIGLDDWGLERLGADGLGLKEVWGSERMAEIRRLWRKKSDTLPCGHCLKREDC